MALQKAEKAHLVIHPCAVAAMFWSGAWGSVPILGITGDTPGLIVICGTMGGLLAQVHGKRFDELRWNAAAVAALQYFAGALTIKWLSSLIPIVGTGVNAAVSLATVEAAGWAFHLILDDDRDPQTLTKQELKEYFGRGKRMYTERKQSGQDDWMKNLPPDVFARVEALSKELASAATSETRRAEIVAEIERLTAPYRPDSDG